MNTHVFAYELRDQAKRRSLFIYLDLRVIVRRRNDV